VTFQQNGSVDGLPYDARLALFRVAEEALGNAARHSGAQHICVVVNQHADRVEVVVDDDGSGFNRQAAMRGPGLGLTAMKERMALVNGTMALKSRRRGGTTVCASVPIEAAS
jgi:two-component system sensor histidine kinase UhpB